MNYTNSQISGIIDEVVHSQRDRDILKRRLCDGIPYERIAQEHGLSTQRIKAIVYRARETLAEYL